MAVLTGDAGNNSLVGTTGSDTLSGRAGNDQLRGQGAQDTLFGGLGIDLLFGDAGDDVLHGDDDVDTLQGGPGADSLFGGNGDDRHIGHGGDDYLAGDDGNDTLGGADGNDRFLGGNGNDVLWGGADNDLVEGAGGDDSLFGDAGLDTLLGAAGNDTLTAHGENDVLRGGAGNDSADGGDGVDTFYSDGSSDHFSWTTVAGLTTLVDLRPTLSGDEGTDTLINVEFLAFDDGVVEIGGSGGNLPPGPVDDLDGGPEQVAENAANGTTVGLTASSEDGDGGTITYSLTDNAGGRFAIGSSGVVTVANGAALDHEALSQHSITVRATDNLGAWVERAFTIEVGDVNETPSAAVDSDPATNRVTLAAAAGASIGITALASDPDGDQLTYSLVTAAGTPITGGRFAIDPTTGVVTVGDPALLTEGAATIRIRATDPGGLRAPTDTQLTIQVVAEGGNAPPSNLRDTDAAANLVSVNAANGTYVGVDLAADDPDGDTLTWQLTGDAGGRFAIDATTGRITVADSALLTAGSYQVTAQVSDGELSASRALTIDVGDPSQFQVNSFTPGQQQARGDHGGSGVAALTGGGYIVVWESEGQEPGADLGGIYAQRYNADGTTLGGELHLNTITDGKQDKANVTALAGGKFLVSWDSTNGGGNADVHYRVFDAAGNAALADRDAHSANGGANNQLYSDAAALGTGGFVLTWTSWNTNLTGTADDDTSTFGVYARRFDADGTGIGDQFLVNNEKPGEQKYSTVATLGSGEFVIAWSDAESDATTTSNIHLQRFSATAGELGGEIVVNSTLAGQQSHAAIAALEGGFVVTWTGFAQAGGSSNDIYMQLFNASGGKVGAERRVNDGTAGSQTNSTVVGLDDGGFLVSWQSSQGDGDAGAILAQRFDATGGAVGDSFVVNLETAGGQRDPHLAELNAGQIVAIWSGNGPGDPTLGSSGGVFGRLFDDLPA